MKENNKKLSPEEIHQLAIAPLPAFNIIPGKLYGSSALNSADHNQGLIHIREINVDSFHIPWK